MTGLEGILKKIEEEAAAAANEITDMANKMAAQITAQAKEEGEQIRAEILEQAKQKAQVSLSRAESSANLLEKKLLLEARQDMINDVIDKAKKKLLVLPDKEYFEVLVKLIKRYALTGSGEVIFSESDKRRIPNGFEETVRKALQGNGTLEISKETRDFAGGFVLIYGDIEVNCTFDSLFYSAMESLRDTANQALFGKEL